MSQQGPQQPFNPPQQPSQPGPPPAPKKTNWKVINIVAGSVAVVVIAIGAATGNLSNDDTTDQGAGTTPDTAQTTAPDNGPTPDPVTTPTNKPTATEGTGCDLDSSPEEYADCLDRFVNGTTTAPKPTKTAPKMTASQEQAIGAAEDYLAFAPFSRKGLIQQLTSEYGSGFSKADATYAVDHIKVNWNEQAARAAKNYLEMTHFSRKGLIQQLESEHGSQFTHAQAVYGVNKAGL